MPANMAVINQILKEIYLPSMTTVEPQTLADCPFRPGTDEHKQWVKEHIIDRQIDPNTQARIDATQTADKRLDALKKQYNRVIMLDPDIDALINNPPEPPILTPVRDPIFYLIQEVNKIWEATGLGPVDDFITFLPQIGGAPSWTTKYMLLDILRAASMKDLQEVKQQRGIIFYAVHNPNYSIMGLAGITGPQQLQYDQVRVDYLMYRS